MSKFGIIDEPVSPGAQDFLDISLHANSLIEFIENSNTPITIGIQGEWGSGKTSLLNSIYHHFNSLTGTQKTFPIYKFKNFGTIKLQ